jgi:hypothetical protein
MAHMGFVQQEALPATLFVAATDSPDGGRIALGPGSHGADGFTRGDGQHDACVLDLEPGQVSGTGDGLKDGEIRGGDGKGTRFPSTHGRNSGVARGLNLPAYRYPEFLALFVSRNT